MDLNVAGPTRCPTCNTQLIVVPDGDLWCGKCQLFARQAKPGPKQEMMMVAASGTVRQEAMNHVAKLQTEGKPAMALEFDGRDPGQVFQALGTAIDFSVQLVMKADMVIALEVFALAQDGRVAVVISGEQRQAPAGGAPAEQDPPAGATEP